MRRRHSDVHDCEVGLVLANEPDELGSVTGLADHFVASLREETDQAFAQQDLVVSDGYPLTPRLIRLNHRRQYAAGRGVGVAAAAAANTVRADASV
jgi:hypothetical protein